MDGVAGAQHDVCYAQEGAVQWNIMEGAKQGQIHHHSRLQLVYKGSSHRCTFLGLNITLSSGLQLSEAFGAPVTVFIIIIIIKICWVDKSIA